MRIVRQFGNGKLNKQQATLMLKSGFGFTDEDVNTFLGIDDSPLTDDEVQQFSMHPDEFLLQELSKIGSKKNEFKVVKSKGVNESFAIELDQLEANVLSILTKEKGNVTPETIAKSLKVESISPRSSTAGPLAVKVIKGDPRCGANFDTIVVSGEESPSPGSVNYFVSGSTDSNFEFRYDFTVTIAEE